MSEDPPCEHSSGPILHGVLSKRDSMLATRTTHTPKPDVPVLVLGLVRVPVRGAQVPGLVIEGAAAQNAPASGKSVGSATASLTTIRLRVQRQAAQASALAERSQPAAKLSTHCIRALVRKYKLLLRHQPPRCCQP